MTATVTERLPGYGGVHAPDADGAGPAADLHRRRAAPAPGAAGPAAERPGGDRADRRHRLRGGPRRRPPGRGDGRGPRRARPRRRAARASPTSSREVEVEAVFDDGTRLVVVVDPFGGGTLGDDGPGAPCSRHRDARPVELADVVTVTVTNTADRARQRHLALPLLRGQPAAALRPRRRVREAPGGPRRLLRPLRPGRRRRTVELDPDRRRPRRHRLRRSRRRPARRPRRARGGAAHGPRLRLERPGDRSTRRPATARGGRPDEPSPRRRLRRAPTAPRAGDRVRLGDTGLVVEVEHDAQQRGRRVPRRVRQDGPRRPAPQGGHGRATPATS